MRVPIKSIRYKEKPDVKETDIQKLADSISETGLLNPITVRAENGSYQLVAGYVRLLALIKLGHEEAEVEVSTMEAARDREVSIHENLKRTNLEWWQEALLVKELHKIRQTQHGAAKSGRPKKDTEKAGWGIRDTARELERALGPTATDIALAEAVESDPSLRNVKDRDTAVMLVRRRAKKMVAEEESVLQDEITSFVHHGNSIDVLKKYPDNTFHVCVTDPPWLNYRGEKKLERDDSTLKVFDEVYRVMRMDSLVYIFLSFEDCPTYVKYLKLLGFTLAKTPLIWHKTNHMSVVGVKSFEYNRNLEHILVAAKGSPVLTTTTPPSSVLEFSIPSSNEMIHPHQKPIDLIVKLLDHSSYAGNVMLDPFGGSGSSAVAARECGRRYVVIERDDEFYAGIRGRLA